MIILSNVLFVFWILRPQILFVREIFMHKFQMKQANLKGKLIYANDVMIVRTYLNRVQSYPYKNGKREKFILWDSCLHTTVYYCILCTWSSSKRGMLDSLRSLLEPVFESLIFSSEFLEIKPSEKKYLNNY